MALTFSRRKAVSVHERRKGVGDGIAGHAEDARGLVKLLEAVEVEEGARGDLAGSGFSAVGSGGEGEGGAGARAEDAADEALFAHGDADHVGVERLVLNHAEDGEIVGQAAGRGDDFDEFGLEGLDALGGLVEALGTAGAGEVVRADEEGGAGGAEGGAELGQLRAGCICSADSTSRSTMWQPVSAAFCRISSSAFSEPGEVAAKGLAAAGGDGRDVAVAVEEGLEIGEGGGWFGQGIEAELDENRVFKCGLGVGKKLGWRGALDGDAQLAYAQARHSRCRRGQRIHRAGDRERHFLQLTHLKGV